MIRSKKYLIFTLLLPILVLLAIIIEKKYILATGQEVILPISGYDPRDILSGHYLIYTVDYNVAGICEQSKTIQSGYICLNPKFFSFTSPSACKLRIKGVCQYGRFQAGIEKYYIPEDKAIELDKQIKEKKASILISVTPTGQAQVKKLLVE